MNSEYFFSCLELVIFTIAVAGVCVSSVALSDATRDVRARKQSNLNGRVMLIATKNRRIALVTLVYFTRELLLYGYASTQVPTIAQRFPYPQAWFSYLSNAVISAVFLWFVIRNYQDYRRALMLAREFGE